MFYLVYALCARKPHHACTKLGQSNSDGFGPINLCILKAHGMAQGDDDPHNPLDQADPFHDDMEDSTMEISLKDIYALSKADKQSSPDKSLAALSPPSAPVAHDHLLNPVTVELDDDIIELDDDLLNEITSEVFNEEDYVQSMHDAEELHQASASSEQLNQTGILEQSYEELFLEDVSSLNDDTDPSVDVFVPKLIGDAISQEPELQATKERAQISFPQDEESWADSTSVFSPNAELLEAARGAFAAQQNAQSEDQTQHMIAVPDMGAQQDAMFNEDATGHFEVPAALLSQLRQQTAETPPPGLVGHDNPTKQAIPAVSVSVMPFHVDAHVDEDGRIIVPEGQPMAGYLKPGLKVRLLVEIIPE